MKKKNSESKKEAYTKPEVHTHEPLRNITAVGPGNNIPVNPTSFD